MLKTNLEIATVELGDNWANIVNSIVKRLEQSFHRHPDCFFTEHDIHSVLYGITKKELQACGVLCAKTSDGNQIMLAHHEYPTPFRCDMKGLRFERKIEKPYKRGHYDLVILNPAFVEKNNLRVVSGKDYGEFASAMHTVEVEPLIWACEVIFFPRVVELPKKAIRLIGQDAFKIKETLGYTVSENIRFCRHGSVLVFTSHTLKEARKLEQQVHKLAEKHELEISFAAARER